MWWISGVGLFNLKEQYGGIFSLKVHYLRPLLRNYNQRRKILIIFFFMPKQSK